MKNISLSIMPSYWCKTNCQYCYLGDLRKDRTQLTVDVLDEKLSVLDQLNYNIDSVSIYGGEISLLDEQYLTEIVQTIRDHIGKGIAIGFCTSGYNRSIFTLAEELDTDIIVPLNQERPDYKKNLQLIKQYNCIIGTVVLPSIINTPIDQLIDFYNSLSRDVYFYQFYPSINVKSPYMFDCKTYTDFLIMFIEQYNKHTQQFKLINLSELKNDDYNPESSGFIYINPYGKWMTTKYENCTESFIEFETIHQWKAYCMEEHFKRLDVCGSCAYYNRCKAEHLVVMNDDYCSGLKRLLQSGCLL